MLKHGLTLESHDAEKSKIATNWIARIRQCMTEGDRPQIFTDALRSARITPSHLDGQMHLEQIQVDQVMAHIVRFVPDISLRMYAKAELTDLGVIGYVAINSDTVGKALTFLIRYHELTTDRFIDSLTVEEDFAVISAIPLMSHIQDYKNIAEDSFAGNWRVLNLLLNDTVDFSKARILFNYPEPDYESSYREVFQCRYQFDAERSELRFPAAWLERPIASANRVMADVCTAMCERLLGAGSASRETSQIVRRLLLCRQGRRMYRLDEAAAELRLSTSQLRKRLYRAGTSYKELVLEVRMALAKHYLEYYGVSPDNSRSQLQ